MLTQVDGKKVDWANMPLNDMSRGNALDSFYTLKLYEVLIKELEKLNLVFHYKTLLSPLIPLLAEVETKGMLIDVKKLEDLKPRIKEDIDKAKDKLYEFSQVKKEDNLASVEDLREIFFLRESGFGLYPPFRTKKTNQPQVDKNTLETIEYLIEEELKNRHE